MMSAVDLAWRPFIKLQEVFPGDSVVKNPPANAGDTDSIADLGRSRMPQSN